MTGPGLRAIVLALSLSAPTAVYPEVLAWTNASGQLALLDLETGQADAIGPLGEKVGKLALDPSGTLYAIDDFNNPPRFLEVDTATGLATVVGDLGIAPFQPVGFTADACGRLWLTGTATGTTNLYQVDPTTGQATLVVELASSVSGLTARGEELLGMVSTPVTAVVRIDPATGAVSVELPLTGGSFGPFALDRTPEGDLWGFGAVFVPIDPVPRGIFRIGPDGTHTFPYVPSVFPYLGLAIGPPAGFCGSGEPPAVPAASPLGLVALAAVLAAAGLWLRRRTDASRSGPGMSPG
jgi:hypothetical protein